MKSCKLKQIILKTHLLVLLGFIFNIQAFASSECANYLNEKLYVTSQVYDEVVNSSLIVPGSWAADFAYLAVNNHLMSQSDPSLGAMGLLVPNGGICAPTCVGNIAASLDFHSSGRRSMYWVQNANIFIDGLIRKYQEIALRYNDPSGLDPLMGTHPLFFSSEFNEKNSEIGVYANHLKGDVTLLSNHYLKKLDNIILGVVTFFLEPNSNVHSRHAIVILGINLESNLIAVVDPNDTSKVLVSAFIYQNRKLYFSLDESLYGSGDSSLVVLDEIVSFSSIR